MTNQPAHTDLLPTDIKEGILTEWILDDSVILLTRYQGEIVAFSAVCPHASADLREGRYVNGRISCNLHGWKFDVRTGRTIWPEDEMCRLKRFAVAALNGRLVLEKLS